MPRQFYGGKYSLQQVVLRQLDEKIEIVPLCHTIYKRYDTRSTSNGIKNSMRWTLMRMRLGYLQAEELPTTPYWWLQQESKGLGIPLAGSSGVNGPSHPSCSCGRASPGFPDLCPGWLGSQVSERRHPPSWRKGTLPHIHQVPGF